MSHLEGYANGRFEVVKVSHMLDDGEKSVRQESEKRSGKETSKWQQIFWAIRTKQAVR